MTALGVEPLAADCAADYRVCPTPCLDSPFRGVGRGEVSDFHQTGRQYRGGQQPEESDTPAVRSMSFGVASTER